MSCTSSSQPHAQRTTVAHTNRNATPRIENILDTHMHLERSVSPPLPSPPLPSASLTLLSRVWRWEHQRAPLALSHTIPTCPHDSLALLSHAARDILRRTAVWLSAVGRWASPPPCSAVVSPCCVLLPMFIRAAPPCPTICRSLCRSFDSPPLSQLWRMTRVSTPCD